MSSKQGWYAKGVEHTMKGQIVFGTDTIKACLIDELQYTVDMDNHESLSDVPSGARFGATTLTNVACTSGLFTADSPIHCGVLASGPEVNAVLFYKDTGVPSTSWLIAYVSGSYAVGLPKTPDGSTPFTIYNRTSGAKIGKLGGHSP